MKDYSPLYNVNKIIVPRRLEKKYIKFSKKLNKYLQNKYKKYYIGLQLYQNKKDPKLFYVIAAYKDVCGIEIAAAKIGNKISKIYDKIWGDKVQRISVFRFLDYTRIIPPQKY
ncbi:MAG: hypothetical protein VB084_13230 [Syntrophomonadaceae bacterium]|nr:hypothetical protein [Syntrophomonadaceae bacterium]